MNIAHEFTPTQIALYEAAKERARRRMITARHVAEETSRGRVIMCLPALEKPKMPKVEVDHDHHIRAWCVWRSKWSGRKVRHYIEGRCDDLGFDIDKLLGPSRKPDLTRARQVIMWEIKTYVKPDMTLPEIGRIFGRDHTTVLHAIRKISAEMGVDYVGLKSRGVTGGG